MYGFIVLALDLGKFHFLSKAASLCIARWEWGKGVDLRALALHYPIFSCFLYLSSLLFYLPFLNIEVISCLEKGFIIWETLCFHFMNKVFRKISKHRDVLLWLNIIF